MATPPQIDRPRPMPIGVRWATGIEELIGPRGAGVHRQRPDAVRAMERARRRL